MVKSDFGMATRIQITANFILAVLVATTIGTPLQWEQIRPVGNGPRSRYMHASASFESAQGLLFYYGGFVSDGRGGMLANKEVWALDSAGQGWEEVKFDNTDLYEGCVDTSKIANTAEPLPRGGHAMESAGVTALMCGGLGDGGVKLEDSDGSIDCWWLTPVPLARWDKLELEPGSAKPPARSGHSMGYDVDRNIISMIGGQDKNNHLLKDCWFIKVGGESSNTSTPWLNKAKWESCMPEDTTAPAPPARYGHGQAVFRESIYVLGGFDASSARNDIWRLQVPYNSSKALWFQIMPTSDLPSERGFHAVWRAGFKIVVHGGQGAQGTGKASVLDDTWQFNLFTLDWSRLTYASDAVPVASNLAVASIMENTAVAFGGLAQDGTPSGKLFWFDMASGWEQRFPSGARPSRRMGHWSMFDDSTNTLMAGYGITENGLVADVWTFHIPSQMWTCVIGPAGSGCNSVSSASAPPPMSLQTSVRSGLYGFVFGGLSMAFGSCPAGKSGSVMMPSTSNNMWVLNMATSNWSAVEPLGTAKPDTRAGSVMVRLGSQSFGATEMQSPLMVISGADIACEREQPGVTTSPVASPCQTKIKPLNDIWVIDSAPRVESATSSDLMAEFDGEDDLIRISLPPWCSSVTHMSVMWIDTWIYPSSKDDGSAILVDAYKDSIPVLRWYLQTKGATTYIRLVLLPGKTEKEVKRWGPFPTSIFGLWHHVAFTVRFGRKYSATSADPAVVVAQAFMFFNGEPVDDQDSFKNKDLLNKYRLEVGLTDIFVGGPNPQVPATGYKNFKGSMDNFRVWWPTCPDTTDPSRCNPYGFIYPRLKNGTIVPGVGIHDKDVTMDMVAKRVQENMFQVADKNTDGLLVQLTFDGGVMDFKISDDSQWSGPSMCSPPGPGQARNDVTDVCPGCEPTCTFGRCENFDLDCIASGLTDEAKKATALEVYSEKGTCQCLNVADCPSAVFACACPVGLARVCEECDSGNYGLCRNGSPELAGSSSNRACSRQSDCTLQGERCEDLAPMFCPKDKCTSWTCSCNEPVGGTETATAGGDFFAVASAMQGVGSCACADLEVATTMPLNQPPKPDYPCCDPDLFGSNSPKMMCIAFGTDAEGYKYCVNATALNHNTDCMIESCCLVEDDNEAGPMDPGAGPGPGVGPGGGSGEGPGPGGGGGDPSTTCSIFIDGSGTFTGVFVSSGGGSGSGSNCYIDDYGDECCIDDYGGEVCCWYNDWGEQECDNGYYRRAVQGIDSGRRVGKNSGAQTRTGRSNDGSESSVVRRPQVSNSARLAKRRNKGRRELKNVQFRGTFVPDKTHTTEQVIAGAVSPAATSSATASAPPSTASTVKVISAEPMHYSGSMRRLLNTTDNSTNSSNVTAPTTADKLSGLEAAFELKLWLRGHPVFPGWDWGGECYFDEYWYEFYCDSYTMDDAVTYRLLTWANTLMDPHELIDIDEALEVMWPSVEFSDYTTCDPYEIYDWIGDEDWSDYTMVMRDGADTTGCFTTVKYEGGMSLAQLQKISAAINGNTQTVQGISGISGLFSYANDDSDTHSDDEKFGICRYDSPWDENGNDLLCLLPNIEVEEEVCGGGSVPGFGKRRLMSGPGCSWELTDAYYTVNGDGHGKFQSHFCGDGQISNLRGEICDDGPLNAAFGPCGDTCSCAEGFFLDPPTQSCICREEPDIVFYAHESNKIQGMDNTLTIRFGELEFTQGINKQPGAGYDLTEAPKKHIEVTISNLVGFDTPSNDALDIDCRGNSNMWGDQCLVGIAPTTGNQWQTGKAKWDQAAGTLKFSIIASLDAGNPDTDHNLEFWTDNVSTMQSVDYVLKIMVTLKNAGVARPGIRLQASSCQAGNLAEQEPDTPTLAGFNALWIDSSEIESAPSETLSRTLYKAVDGVSALVAEFVAPKGMLQSGCGMYVEAFEESYPSLDGFSWYSRKSSSFIGAQDSMIFALMVCNGVPTYGVELGATLTVHLQVDTAELRSAGGCYTTETSTARICVPSYVGAYAFNSQKMEWQGPSQLEASSISASQITYTTSSTSDNWFGAVSALQCCDYNGLASSCGDMICMAENGGLLADSPGTLGDGTLSKMPTLTNSARPAVADLSKLTEYHTKGTSGVLSFKTRSGWQKVCIVDEQGECTTSQTQWPEPRFMHSAVAVSKTRILIYGGIGCSRTDPTTSFCTEIGGPLSDLWELDTLKVGQKPINGKITSPMAKIEMSPQLSGLTGMSMVALDGVDHRLLMFGGSSTPFFLNFLNGSIPSKPIYQHDNSTELFEYRNVLFRAGKAINETVGSVGSLSGFTASSNSTTVVLFGGFMFNSLTNAVFTYTISAANPTLGLNVNLVEAVGPSARGYPGLVKPDDTSILLYGGTAEVESSTVRSEGLSDLWQLDLKTQNWLRVHSSTDMGAPVSTSYAAFKAWYQDGQTYLISQGGIHKGYKSGVTFWGVYSGSTEIPGRPDEWQIQTEGGVTADVWFWTTSKMGTPKVSDWFGFQPLTPMDEETYDICCQTIIDGVRVPDECPVASRGIGCIPSPSAMHTLEVGTFTGGANSMIMYGGLSLQGEALSEIWRMDVEGKVEVKEYGLVVDGLNNTAFDLDAFKLQAASGKFSMGAGCPPIGRKDLYSRTVLSDNWQDPAGGVSVLVRMKLDSDMFDACMAKAYFQSGAWEAAVFNTSLEGTTVNVNSQFNRMGRTGNIVDMKANIYPYDQTVYCKDRCVRGFCQYTNLNDTESRWTTPEVELENDNYLMEDIRCGGDGTTHVLDEFGEGGTCGAGYTCSHPGPRHGHRTIRVSVQGQAEALMVFGGESGNFDAAPQLTNQVHIGTFSATALTFVNLPTSAGTDDNPNIISSRPYPHRYWASPAPRRDSSIAIMGNTGSENGRLLVFGGFAAVSTSTKSAVYDYLERQDYGVYAFNDLWYLDLSTLTVECARSAQCGTILNWYQVDVPGGSSRPLERWGAGIVLDPQDNLYVVGGATYDSTTKTFGELSDTYLYQMRDPFYKYCTATGSGLRSAKAGVPAHFYIKCYDIFGLDPSTAKFKVDIEGDVIAGGARINPTPFSLATPGLYKVEFTLLKVGAYRITVSVGRGGNDFMEGISGIEPESTRYNDVFEFTVSPENPTEAMVEDCTVVPGDTDPRISVANGDYLTASTAGITGAFRVTARDSFENKRPGGDTVNALMALWNPGKDGPIDPSADPDTGTVKDNRDGQFEISYRLTRAGMYRMDLQIASALAADAPYMITVHSDAAVPEKTFVFGSLLNVKQGDASNIYAQTRDRYGNYIRLDPNIYPEGIESVEFELCIVIGDQPDPALNLACAGGKEEEGVGKEIKYSIGPAGKQINPDTGEYYWGIYKFTFNPLVQGSFVPQVKHNGTYVKCYFDTDVLLPGANETSPSSEFPPIASVDNCMLEVANSANNTFAGRRFYGETRFYAADIGRDYIQIGGPDEYINHPRRAQQIRQGEFSMNIQSSFTYPDTESVTYWLTTAPILCAFVGAGFEFLTFVIQMYRERKNKVSAEAAKELANEGDREEKAPERISKVLGAFRASSGAPKPADEMGPIQEGSGEGGFERLMSVEGASPEPAGGASSAASMFMSIGPAGGGAVPAPSPPVKGGPRAPPRVPLPPRTNSTDIVDAARQASARRSSDSSGLASPKDAGSMAGSVGPSPRNGADGGAAAAGSTPKRDIHRRGSLARDAMLFDLDNDDEGPSEVLVPTAAE